MNKKKTVELPVEMVENLKEKLEWVSTSITFWKLYNKWPTNLIQDVIDDCFVSLSHIIDK